MISAKDDTQRRMLSPKYTGKNLKLPTYASIANRSPNHKYQNKEQISSTTLSSRKKYIQNQEQNSLTLSQNVNDKKYTTQQNLEMVKGVVLENGDRYDGQMIASGFAGNGIYTFKNQKMKYEGAFYEGKRHGFGVMTNYENGQIIYEGEWSEDKKHGEGRYVYSRNNYYQGGWVEDEKSGKGVYHFQEGVYNGNWDRNLREGLGSLKLNNGLEIKGTFERDQFIKGLIRYPNEDEYSGPVRNNSRHGDEGAYIEVATNNRYKGQWQNDLRHGKGTILYENGDQLSGTFQSDILSEEYVVMYRWSDGSVFNGWFKNNKPHKGNITKLNGQKIEI